MQGQQQQQPKKRIHSVAQKSIQFTAFQIFWVPGTSRICALGSSDAGFGALQVYNVVEPKPSTTFVSGKSTTSVSPTYQLRLFSETEKQAQFKCATFRASESSNSGLATGDFDGRIGIWDLQRTEVPLTIFKAHKDVVNCMDGSKVSRPEIVSGCRDGTVKVWDTRQKGEAVATMISHSNPQDVWCVAMGQATTVGDLTVAAGYENGDLRMFDLRAGTSSNSEGASKAIFETNVGHGICSIDFNQKTSTGGRCVVTTLEGTLHSFELDASSRQVKSEEQIVVQMGEDSTLWQVRHIPQRPDQFVVSDGGGQLHLYSHGLNDSTPITKLDSQSMGREGILSLDFNDDLEGLFAYCNLDNQVGVGMLSDL